MRKNLSIKKVAEVWFAAYLHNIKDLANDAVVWMARNWKILKEDKQFCKWVQEHPDLLLEITTLVTDKCKCIRDN